MYVLTRELDADSSEEEMEKLVEPKEKELLLTYMDAVASYVGLRIARDTPSANEATIKAHKTIIRILLQSALQSFNKSISISSSSFFFIFTPAQ
jgi:hypothetical protein